MITTTDRAQFPVMELEDEASGRKGEEIPKELWNMILPCGSYLKNIMEFSGYTKRESIVKLADKNEISKMFEFVKSMSGVIEDKKAMFGVFDKCPNKVMLLPGLEPTFMKFIDAVDRLGKSLDTNTNDFQTDRVLEPKVKLEKIPQVTRRWDEIGLCQVTVLASRMARWIGKQKNCIEKLKEFGFEEPAQTFDIMEATGFKRPKDIIFTCKVCHKNINLQISKDFWSLSNAQRHIMKKCWLNNGQMKSQNPVQKHSVNFYSNDFFLDPVTMA